MGELGRKRFRRAALFVGVVTVLVAAAAAFAVVDDPADPDVRVLTEEETAVHTATNMADLLGISIEEASSRLEFQSAFTDVIEGIEDLLPRDMWAGGAIDDDGLSGVLRFKGDVPRRVSGALAASDLVGVELRGGMEFSRAEAQERAKIVHNAAVALGFTNVSSSFDSATQRVSLSVGSAADVSIPGGSALREALVEKVAAGPDGGKYPLSASDIDVREGDGPVIQDHSS